VKVPAGDDHLRAVGSHALDLVAPLASRLDRGLDGLGAGVHQQRHLHPAELGQVAEERAHLIVVERAARERHPVELLLGRGDQLGMTVPEVQRRVRRQHVEVPPALDVGDPAALRLGHHDGEWVVVVRGRPLDELDVLLRGSWLGRADMLLRGHLGASSSVPRVSLRTR
jgi:hypothetical protein